MYSFIWRFPWLKEAHKETSLFDLWDILHRQMLHGLQRQWQMVEDQPLGGLLGVLLGTITAPEGRIRCPWKAWNLRLEGTG